MTPLRCRKAPNSSPRNIQTQNPPQPSTETAELKNLRLAQYFDSPLPFLPGRRSAGESQRRATAALRQFDRQYSRGG
jgi:hypothetical protein